MPTQNNSNFRNTIRATILVLLTCLCIAAPASAQRGDFEIGAGLGFAHLDDKLGGDGGLTAELRVGYFVTDRFQLEIQNSRASSIFDGSFDALTLNALYHWDRKTRIVPYVLVGLGRADVTLDKVPGAQQEDDATALRAAIGARFWLGSKERASLRLELGALNEDSFGDDSTHLGFSSVFSWRFGTR